MSEIPRKLTKAEFTIYARYLSRVSPCNDLDIEYKAYEGLYEFFKPEHVREFFEKGYMTIGQWRLWHDLEISDSKDPPDHEPREILQCTDGNNFELPYFDRLYQKYTYLVNNPDRIVNIGLRRVRGPVASVVRPNPKDMFNRKKITVTFQQLMNGEKNPKYNDVVTITNMEESLIPIFKRVGGMYKMKRDGNNVTVYARHPHVALSGFRLHFLNKFGVDISPSDVFKFPHFISDYVKVNCERAGISLSESQTDISKYYQMLKDRKLRSNLERGGFSDPALKGFLSLPVIVILLFDINIRHISIIDIVKYYHGHPEHITDYTEAEKDENNTVY